MNQQKGGNNHRKYYMISIQDRILLDPMGKDRLPSPVHQGPVVQNVVSLSSSLRVIWLTVLADSIYNILIFFAEKNVSSFYTAKATHIFSAKIFSIFACHLM